ncbi:MAG: response regulator [Salinarimonas sp.]|nr:response regulator [Salinarimonas sp.]
MTTGIGPADDVQAGASAARLHVLIAEPDPEQRAHVAEAVGAAVPTAQISTVADGEEAVKAIIARKPGVLFINVKMPGISGAEAVAITRQEKVQPLTVLMSDKVLSRWVALSNELEAYEFLKKPYDAAHIAGLMQAIIRMHMPMRVLLVEGSETTRTLMTRLMRKSRFNLQVEETDSGVHAVKLMRSGDYDVALIDLHLNGMDGLETACQVKDAAPKTALVLISAPGSEKIEAASRHFGFTTFLQKPFYAHHIEDMLHEVFGLRRPYLLNATGRVHARSLRMEEERRARRR